MRGIVKFLSHIFMTLNAHHRHKYDLIHYFWPYASLATGPIGPPLSAGKLSLKKLAEELDSGGYSPLTDGARTWTR